VFVDNLLFIGNTCNIDRRPCDNFVQAKLFHPVSLSDGVIAAKAFGVNSAGQTYPVCMG